MDDDARRRFTMAPKNPPKSNRSQLCVNSSSAKANQTKSFFFFFFKSSKVSLQPKLNRNESVFDVDVDDDDVNVVAADLVQVESRTDWRIVFASPYGRKVGKCERGEKSQSLVGFYNRQLFLLRFPISVSSQRNFGFLSSLSFSFSQTAFLSCLPVNTFK